MRTTSRIRTALLALPLILTLASCAGSPHASMSSHTDHPFNGVNLEGWWGESTTDPRTYINLPADELEARRVASYPDIQKHWSVEIHDGVPELVNDGEGLYLTTEKFYRDFDLSLEYRTVAGADSGVYLRGVPQVQIWDTTEAGGKWNIGADKGSGGLWNNSPEDQGGQGKDPLVHADRPFGQWNTLRVRMEGEIVSVWLNDQLVVDQAKLENYFDRDGPIPDRGPIQLQTHGGEIRWRKITVTELNVGRCGTGAWLQEHRSSTS